jgi:hypothetical protein
VFKLQSQWKKRKSAGFGNTYTKTGRLAWPLHKNDTQICEAFHIKRKETQQTRLEAECFSAGSAAPVLLTVQKCVPLVLRALYVSLFFFSADYPLSLIICEVVFKPEQASDLPGESFESLQRLSQTC